ncbi:MAG: hypothetical protein JOY93_10175, partial [Acidobacteriales bacterium]|nr:hypothetical protein [Terriglobales bacterium]
AIVKGTLHEPAPWTNLILTLGWILSILAGFVLTLMPSRRQDALRRPVETIFAILYVVFIYTYNAPQWARGDFPRFAIPVLPFAIIALLPLIPKPRVVLWMLTVIFPILAAASAVGIKNVFHL